MSDLLFLQGVLNTKNGEKICRQNLSSSRFIFEPKYHGEMKRTRRLLSAGAICAKSREGEGDDWPVRSLNGRSRASAVLGGKKWSDQNRGSECEVRAKDPFSTLAFAWS